MNVQAINSISSSPKFEGKMEKTANNQSAQSYPQMSAPMSKDAAKAIENSAMISFGQRKSHPVRNAIIAGSLGAMTLGGMTSCDKGLIRAETESWATTSSSAWAWACGGNDGKPTIVRDTITVHDTDTITKTVFEPVYIKEYPWHLADSLIRQGLNIGVQLNGPTPTDTQNHVAFIGSVAYNEYDYKLYETKLDSIGTNAETLSLITKVSDMYDDPKNPKISYIRTEVVDVPGRGIKFTRFILPENMVDERDKIKFPKASDPRFRYADYEIRTNNRDGRNNSERIYDRLDNLPDGREAEYVRGNKLGQFLFGSVVYDKNGNPYIGEDGKPEKAYYDFSNAKMLSSEVKYVEIPNGGGSTYTW